MSRMVTVHVDSIRTTLLLGALGFFGWNWASAEREVRRWESMAVYCVVSVEPRAERLERLVEYTLGLARRGADPATTAEATVAEGS